MALKQMKFTRSIQGEASGTQRITIEGPSLVGASPAPVLAAKPGALTTRTSGTAGTLTMAAGHGITTGMILDLYWDNPDGSAGAAYGAVAGTVAGDSVPFTLAAGDALPALVGGTYPILAGKTAVVPFVIAGDSVAGILGVCGNDDGQVTLLDNADAVLYNSYLTKTAPLQWCNQDATTNPLAGMAIAKARFSTSGTANSSSMSVEAIQA